MKPTTAQVLEYLRDNATVLELEAGALDRHLDYHRANECRARAEELLKVVAWICEQEEDEDPYPPWKLTAQVAV